MGRATVSAGLATMACKASASTSVASVVQSWLSPRTVDSLFPVGPILLTSRRSRVLFALKSRLSQKPVYLLPQLRAPIVKPVKLGMILTTRFLFESFPCFLVLLADVAEM